MKNLFFLSLIAVFLLSCEDRKKAPETPNENKEVIDEPAEEPVQAEDKVTNEEEKKEEKYNFPYLTNANIEEFLKEYGKENRETQVEIETDMGTITLQLYNDTPLHRANFIFMVKNGYFNTTTVHRVLNDFIIQAGNSDRLSTAGMRSKIGKYTVPAEIKHKHRRGALAAAKEYRDNPDDRSSSFEFYIVQSHKGAHHLDPNYTVFGHVISGMDVVDKIVKVETDGSEWPLHNISIKVSILK